MQRRLQAERTAAEHWQAAQDHCARLGLMRRPDETSEQHVNRMRAHLRRLMRDAALATGQPIREPGQDDEEGATA